MQGVDQDNAVTRFEQVVETIQGIVSDQEFMAREYLEEQQSTEPRSTQSTRAAAARVALASMEELLENVEMWARRHETDPMTPSRAPGIDIATMVVSAKARSLIAQAATIENAQLPPDEEDDEQSDTSEGAWSEANSGSDIDGSTFNGDDQPYHRPYFLQEHQLDQRRKQLARKVLPMLTELDEHITQGETKLHYQMRAGTQLGPDEVRAHLREAVDRTRRARDKAQQTLAAVLSAETQDNIQAHLESRDWDTVHDVARFYGKVSEKQFRDSTHMVYMRANSSGSTTVAREPTAVKAAWATAYAQQFSADRDPPETTGEGGRAYKEFFKPLPKSRQADLSQVLQSVTYREMRGIIKAIPNKSSPGPDGFQAAFLKACPDHVTDFFAAAFLILMSSATVPPRFLQ